MKVTHPKGNTTQTQTRQVLSEGQTSVVWAFKPTKGVFEVKGGSKVEDFEGAAMD